MSTNNTNTDREKHAHTKLLYSIWADIGTALHLCTQYYLQTLMRVITERRLLYNPIQAHRIEPNTRPSNITRTMNTHNEKKKKYEKYAIRKAFDACLLHSIRIVDSVIPLGRLRFTQNCDTCIRLYELWIN